MRKLLLILFLCIFGISAAQFDSEHWFAPFAASPGTNSSLQAESYLYLSTSETTPFPVQILNGNNLFGTVTISKGAPQTVSIPYNLMMTDDIREMFKPNSLGLNVKGPKKFFANFRFEVPNHAEIVTSKGLAGIGKTFFAAMAPNTTAKAYLTSTIGITATEDNTVVNISGYDAAIVFADGTQSPTKNFTLDKGQSYILNVRSSDAQANLTGLIGAKIEASNPISVSNGNFNAIYTFENFTNNDVLMDQSVPIERLGKDFILVKGNGPALNNMESGLIVATEDNTKITVNGTELGVILNKGQYFIADSGFYLDKGNNHFNMSISTSENVYLYQLLAGVDDANGNPYATGGFNFIPALSCFLPNKIDEISDINKIGNDFFNAKLNIITEKGADVFVNGTKLGGTQGPFPVTGNPNWETYNVLQVTGNITVNSTKAVTAGIASGNGAVGYGGYFAGFSSVPVITKGGDCFVGVLLQVDDSYDQYQWFLNGVSIPGETTYFIDPQTYGTGIYTCLVTKLNCDTKLSTPYQFTVCPPIATSTITLGSCKDFLIQPNFTTSTQIIDPSKTKIRVQGIYGTATINATTGTITYTPQQDLPADVTDTFVYYIEGNGAIPDSEFFKVIVNIKVLKFQDDILKVCANPDGTGTYNLTLANINFDSNDTIVYYKDAALSQIINNFTSYNTPPTTVYAKITSQFGCSETAKIQLQITETAQINTSNLSPFFCDNQFIGSISIDFSAISAQIITNYSSSYIVKYYLSPIDQQAGNNNFLPNNYTISANTTVYFRVESSLGCTVQFGQLDLKVGNKISLFQSSVSENLCDNLLEGNVVVQLSDYKNLFSADSSLSATFYQSEIDAQKKQNPVSANQTISATTTFYIRFESSSECPNIGALTIIFKSPIKSTTLVNQIICGNATATLEAGSGFDSYLWNTGETTSAITVPIGEYFVDLGKNGCVYRQKVSVIAATLPVITNIDVSGSTATIFVTGGIPPYQYSLDNITFQNSNIFTNISRGTHTVYVKDSQNCETVQKDFLIINLINVITPNNDGFNDTLDYSELKIKKDVKLEIYDRYGKNVYLSQDKKYIWDGKISGRTLPTGTYWYLLQWTEPDTDLRVSYKGWVLLKNRN